MSAAPRLSVVVPYFNIERDFAACLESLRLQFFADAEFVLVDDGSSDRSAVIAREFAERDDRFVLLEQANAGAGAARNTGAEVARGEYLAFFDCDDVVHPGFWARAIAMLDDSGSDLLVAGAERFDTFGLYPSVLHSRVITRTLTGTRLALTPELGLDRMVWNKVIRRSFWDAAGLRYRTIRYEDFPFCLEAHLAATRVDVLGEVGCYWRQRDGGEQSVTQRTTDPGQLAGRFASDNIVLNTAEAGAPEALPLIREHFLEIDVTAFARAAGHLSGEAAATVMAQGAALLDRLGSEVLAGASAFHRLQARLLRAGDAEALARLHRHKERFGPRGRVRREHGRWVEEFPGLAPALDSGPPTTTAELEVARWSPDGSLQVEVAVESTAALSAGVRARVLLEPTTGGAEPIDLPVRARSRQGIFGPEDGLSLTVDVDVDALVSGDRLDRSFWRFRVVVENEDFEARSAVHVVSRSRGRTPEPRPVAGPPGTVVQVGHRAGDGFGLSVQRPVAVVTGVEPRGEQLRVSGTIRHDALGAGDDLTLVLTGPDGVPVETAVRVDRSVRPAEFEAEVAVRPLVEGVVPDPDHWSPVPAQHTFAARLQVDGVERVLFVGPGVPVGVGVVGEQVVRACRGPAGLLAVVVGRNDPEVTAVRWTGPASLRFDGVWRGAGPLPAEVRVQHQEFAPDPLRVALTQSGSDYWFEVDVEELIHRGPDELAGPHPDPWHFVFALAGGRTVQNHDRHRTQEFAERRVIAGRPVELRIAGGDIVRLSVG